MFRVTETAIRSEVPHTRSAPPRMHAAGGVRGWLHDGGQDQIVRRCERKAAATLNLRYDPATRSGFVRLREGATVRTRQLSPQATAEYDRRGRLLAVFVTELDPAAAQFLRTADEQTLLRVIRARGEPAPLTTRRRHRPRA